METNPLCFDVTNIKVEDCTSEKEAINEVKVEEDDLHEFASLDFLMKKDPLSLEDEPDYCNY